MAIQNEYETYTQVPIYRQKWFFFASIIIPVSTLVILLTGNVYYKNKDGVQCLNRELRLVLTAFMTVFSINFLWAVSPLFGFSS
jgi:hypothetical protein